MFECAISQDNVELEEGRMITKWKVANFKAIRKETELEIGPITILTGANSSGKSAFIQSMLLFGQTIAERPNKPHVVLNGELAELGYFDDLRFGGASVDRITIGCTCEEQGTTSGVPNVLGWGSTVAAGTDCREDSLRLVRCEMSFGVTSDDGKRDAPVVRPSVTSASLSCTPWTREQPSWPVDTSATMGVCSIRYDERLGDSVTSGSSRDDLRRTATPETNLPEFNVSVDEATLRRMRETYRSVTTTGGTLQGFLPNSIDCHVDWAEQDAFLICHTLRTESHFDEVVDRRWERPVRVSWGVVNALKASLVDSGEFDRVMAEKFAHVYDSPYGRDYITLVELVLQLQQMPREGVEQAVASWSECDNLYERVHSAIVEFNGTRRYPEDRTTAPMPHDLATATDYLFNVFHSSLHYLGSFREQPKRVFPSPSIPDPISVGLQGEYAAYVLSTYENRTVKYIRPPEDCDKQMEFAVVSDSLQVAVNEWLRYLGVANSVQATNRGVLGVELRVEPLGDEASSHHLTHVGIGVHQALPILVMCLLAESDSMLILEQPELRLQPTVQVRLADFLLSISRLRRQCIIETHSEYLVDQLRYRMAAAPISMPLHEDVKLYFAEKDGQETSFREVVVNRYGAIVDWPRGFFEESCLLAEKLLMASASKRRQERKSDT